MINIALGTGISRGHTGSVPSGPGAITRCPASVRRDTRSLLAGRGAGSRHSLPASEGHQDGLGHTAHVLPSDTTTHGGSHPHPSVLSVAWGCQAPWTPG